MTKIMVYFYVKIEQGWHIDTVGKFELGKQYQKLDHQSLY